VIAALFALMLTLSQGGDPCSVGQTLDWYAWNRTPDSQIARLAVTYHADDVDFIVYDAPGEIVLFVYGPSEARQGSIWHGRCARSMPR
jgi:hypothetical protein